MRKLFNPGVVKFYVIIVVMAIISISLSYLLSIEKAGDITMQKRNIETPLKMWLNGYLGMFFHFKMTGTLAWVIIPFLIGWAFNFKKMNRSLQSVLIAFTGIVILIAIKGYFNYRYQLTIYPIIVAIIILASFFVISKKYPELRIHIVCGLFLLFLANANFAMYFSKIASRILHTKENQLNSKDSNPMFPENLKGTFSELTQLINQQNESIFLVNDLSLFYYYTEKRGVYMWGEKDIYYDSLGYNYSLIPLEQDQYNRKLIDTLKCDYIFSSQYYNEMATPKLKNFIAEFGELTKWCYEGGNYYLLYKIRERKAID